ncbi:MAG: peptidase M23 [Herpetosiphonaceae bacterium]|nr:MAG: peptidase M23 [Herpetosiphonaceae bacterium]
MADRETFLRRRYPSRRVAGIKVAVLPWADMPRPMVVLLLVNLVLLLILPLVWPVFFSRTQPQQRARVGSAAEEQRPRPTITGRIAAAPENIPTRPLLIDADRLRWSPRFGVAEVEDELAKRPLAERIDQPGGRRLLAETIAGQGLRWGINPQVLIVLLELQEPIQGGTVPLSKTAALQDSAERARTIAQLARELRSGLHQPPAITLTLADGFVYLVPPDIDQSSYALLNVLVQDADRRQLQQLLSSATGSFRAMFKRRFGDPRRPYGVDTPDTPFLVRPFNGLYPATARFDHSYPIFEQNGVVLGGPGGEGLGYDGHNGWDYTMPEGTPIRAAAPGYILFAGTMDNECATPAGVVVIEHEGGYRTLYWHLRSIAVAAGNEVEAGALLGESGATGCATGPHLHFGVQRLGRDIDPYGWCGPEQDPWERHPAGARSAWLWLDQASPCPLPPGASIADDGDPATTLLVGNGWYRSADGNNGGAHFTYGQAETPEALIIWRPALPANGRYRCYAFLPSSAAGAGTATYHITAASGTASVTIDQGSMAGSWANLGAYTFTAGQLGRIELRDSDGTPGGKLWADAVACTAEP